MRLANRRDSTHKEVSQAFRALGWKVADLSRVGSGFPDILIARSCCKMALIEIKATKGKRAENQIDFAEYWPVPIYVARNTEDAENIHLALIKGAR